MRIQSKKMSTVVVSCLFFLAKHSRRRGGKVRRRPGQWHCARQVLHDTSLALDTFTDHCPELPKKQLHTMNELVVEGDFEWGLEPVCCWL